MCDLTEQYKHKTFTGYKVVLVDNKTKKIYSPATGIEYKEGAIKVPKKVNEKHISETFIQHLLNKESSVYRDNMVGRTCVFTKKNHANNAMWQHHNSMYSSKRVTHTLCLAKIKISGDLMSGTYTPTLFTDKVPVIGGKNIVSIEICE